MRGQLAKELVQILKRAGYRISECSGEENYCLDLAARRDERTIFIKTVDNVDYFRRECAEELRALARTFSASPLIVGKRMQKGELEESIAYERFSIPAVAPRTLYDAVLRGRYPLVYSKRGGLYVKVDGAALRRAREELGLSLGELAEKVGVSRKAIYAYEKEDMEATLQTAIRLEESLQTPIASQIDIFDWKPLEGEQEYRRMPHGILARKVFKKLSELGLEALGLRYAPFDIHVKEFRADILAQEASKHLEKRVETVCKLAELTGTEPVVVVESEKIEVEEVKIVSVEKITKVKNAEDLESVFEIDMKTAREA